MYVSLDGNESHDQCNDISTGTYNNNTIVPIIYISAIQKKQIIRGHHEMIALDIVVIITIHGMVTWTSTCAEWVSMSMHVVCVVRQA